MKKNNNFYKLLILIILIPVFIIAAISCFIQFLASNEKYINVSSNSTENKSKAFGAKLEKNGETLLNMEIARTDQEQMTGLMNRKDLDQNEGMLFIFSNEQNRTFWMKNTYISLDIAFIDENYQIINIEKNATPLDTNRRYSSKKPAKFVIEANAGWFEKNNISDGEILSIDIVE